jgi:hypothetical protein
MVIMATVMQQWKEEMDQYFFLLGTSKCFEIVMLKLFICIGIFEC